MKKIAISLLTTSLLLGGCTKEFEEINTNPLNPEDYLTYALFNGTNYALIYSLHGNDNSASMMGGWMQYMSQTTYTKESRYQTKPSAADGFWQTLYKSAHKYKKIIDINQDPKLKADAANYGNNKNQIAAAQIMMAYTFSILVESFGDVPYYSCLHPNDSRFQALQVEKYVTPAYTTQKDIYLDILETLDHATKEDNVVIGEYGEDYTDVFTKGDFLFGSIGKMRRFGRSLQLRIANHLRGVTDPDIQNAIRPIITRYTGVGSENTPGKELLKAGENVQIVCEDNSSNGGPINYNYFISNRLDYSPSNVFVKLLAGNFEKAKEQGHDYGLDPRLQKYFAPKGNDKWSVLYFGNSYYNQTTIDSTKYAGMPYGMQEADTASQFDGGEGVSLFATSILKQNSIEVYMDYSEVCFILSEIRGWNQAKYLEGVEASMDKWGVSATDSYRVAVLAKLRSLPSNEANVLTQKYISLYMNPNEAWTEYRRTGYPKFLIKNNQRVKTNKELSNGDRFYQFRSMQSDVTQIPDRLNYPGGYSELNQASYQQAIDRMGGSDSRTYRLLFATRP